MRGVDTDDEDESGGGTLREIVVTIAAALLLAWVVQGFLVKPYRIPSGSMENTLRCRDRVLVDRVSYRFHHPHRLDIVVFKPPAGKDNPNMTGKQDIQTGKAAFIKRIIGLPGDRVEVKDNHAWVDGKPLKEPYLHPRSIDQPLNYTRNWGPHTVPKGSYLMLGDHRDDSADGRVFGYVPRNDIIGRTFMVYWPPTHIGGIPDKDPGGAKAREIDRNCDEFQQQTAIDPSNG